MSADYHQLEKEAQRLHGMYKDVVDDRSQPLAQTLIVQTKEVFECFESNRPPRMVEDRIREVQQLLNEARAMHGAVISDNDYNNLFKAYDRLRAQLRQLPNY